MRDAAIELESLREENAELRSLIRQALEAGDPLHEFGEDLYRAMCKACGSPAFALGEYTDA